MGLDDLCNTGLVLALGFPSSSFDHHKSSNGSAAIKIDQPSKSSSIFEQSLTLSLCGDHRANYSHSAAAGDADLHRQSSAASSLTNASVKREKEAASEEAEVERVSSRVSDEDEDFSGTRKKLRLTKAQSALLEESFRQQSTLNPKQKQELARELNLRPRQVEVWFQNRRARTKLKQTELDCEFLKKCCETLTEENQRLHKELQDLKALKLAQPLYMHLPAATLTVCPSCERLAGAGENAPKTAFNLAPKPLFYNPFTNPSAAC